MDFGKNNTSPTIFLPQVLPFLFKKKKTFFKESV